MSGIASHMPIRKTYWYSTSASHGLRYLLKGILRPLRDVALEAAEDYHRNHNGWELCWPLDFFLYDTEEGQPIGCFEVERETVPEFYAWERELPASVDAVDPHADSTGTPSTRDSVSSSVTCRVCRGYGFIAQKRCVDDGYGEVDSCPYCEERRADDEYFRSGTRYPGQ